MSYQDPGEQTKGRRRRRSSEPAQPSLLDAAPAPSGRQQGLERKRKALEQHESGHEDRLGYIREQLKALYREREREAHAAGRFGHDERGPFVTADDAARILEAAGNMGYDDEAERRNWFGSLFREKGWRWVEPKLVPSLRAEMNGRAQRTWAWKP